MLISEFSDQFDVLYNNITSNQAPGLNEYEKSLFLTKAEKEIVKNYFSANSTGNTLKQGFDDSAKRQADFSILMKTALCGHAEVGGNITVTVKKYTCTSWDNSMVLRAAQINFIKDNVTYAVPNGTYNITNTAGVITIFVSTGEGTSDAVTVVGYPYSTGSITVADETQTLLSGRLDDRSDVFIFPSDTFIVVNESIKTVEGRYLQVIPLRYDQYTDLMSKPFKYPLKNQAWRLMNSGSVSQGAATKYVEIITNTWDTIGAYNIRYVRVPRPIIVAELGDLSIDNESHQSTECEIDPILHEDILQRAVELAKVAWTSTGQDNIQAVMQAGTRSE